MVQLVWYGIIRERVKGKGFPNPPILKTQPKDIICYLRNDAGGLFYVR
jgi:hypothetical protein